MPCSVTHSCRACAAAENNEMEFYANDTVQWKAADGHLLEGKVNSSNEENVNVLLTKDDKELPLEVGDEVTHNGNYMRAC